MDDTAHVLFSECDPLCISNSFMSVMRLQVTRLNLNGFIIVKLTESKRKQFIVNSLVFLGPPRNCTCHRGCRMIFLKAKCPCFPASLNLLSYTHTHRSAHTYTHPTPSVGCHVCHLLKGIQKGHCCKHSGSKKEDKQSA